MHTPPGQRFRLAFTALGLCALQACTSPPVNQSVREPALQASWGQIDTADSSAQPTPGWLAQLRNDNVIALAAEAQAANYELARARARVWELREAVTSTGAGRFPRLEAGLDTAANDVERDDGEGDSGWSWTAGIELSWELDIWGKLSDRQRVAHLNYQSALAGLQQQHLQLVADVASGWFNTVANAQLTTLLQRRLENVSTDLQRLEQGYRRGLNQALDVYLSRNTVADSRANLARQEQALLEAVINLQRLLSRYPDGTAVTPGGSLPELAPSTPAGTPAGLLQRRPDIRQAWLDLLAADATLAAAHKDRFPSFSLVAQAGFTSDALHQLLDVGMTAWSVGASLVQPMFEAGRLKSLEAQAMARVAQAEQVYLNTVFSAIAEVEQLLSAEDTLRRQLTAQRESRSNANTAYELSLQQYARGLVEYTTVLEAQRRAFDAQTNAITLHFQTIANRINLHRALGGDFARTGATATQAGAET